MKEESAVAAVYDRRMKNETGAHTAPGFCQNIQNQSGSYRQPLQGKSQTPGGDLYNLWRQQSNFLGIIDEDAIGAIFLLDKCRQGL